MKKVTRQLDGKYHLRYIKKLATELWRDIGSPQGKFRDCIKSALKMHRDSILKQIPDSPPKRCSYCGIKMIEQEFPGEYCFTCRKKNARIALN